MLGGVLLDDRSAPPLRSVIGTMLRRSTRADFAVGNVRLGAIDLTAGEVRRIRACRLLIGHLDVDMIADTADVAALGGRLAHNLAVLHTFVASGRLELRAAGTVSWFPDFSVLRGLPVSPLAPSGAACLVGAHYFSTPVVPGGASFTCALTGPAAVYTARTRFDELWAASHDVLPVVRELLRELSHEAHRPYVAAGP